MQNLRNISVVCDRGQKPGFSTSTSTCDRPQSQIQILHHPVGLVIPGTESTCAFLWSDRDLVRVGVEKPGFFYYLPGNGKILKETRFLAVAT